MGIRTVVDLRAEDLSPTEKALPEQAGLKVIRMPIRDGQTPTPEDVTRFLATVRAASGQVYVHCAAGVGRSGSMSAAYLVQTGQADASEATRRSLAIGPPSLEQIAFMRGLDEGEVERPSRAAQAISRTVDAPRRIWSRITH